MNYFYLLKESMTEKISQHFYRESTHGLVFLLKELTNEENFLLVCKALIHNDYEISIGAALALGHMKDIRAVPYLLRAVLTTDQKRAEAIIWALGEIGDESAVPFLVAALEANFVPKSVMLALGKIGSVRTIDIILETLKNADETLRILAVKALAVAPFETEQSLVVKIKIALNTRLVVESSRRVKLMLSVIKSRLEKIEK
jgi:HEAT repeat protein